MACKVSISPPELGGVRGGLNALSEPHGGSAPVGDSGLPSLNTTLGNNFIFALLNTDSGIPLLFSNHYRNKHLA